MMKSCTAPPAPRRDDPENAGQIAELRGERGSNERTGSGDGGEMMAEQNPFVGGFEIVAVAQTFGGRGAPVVQCHHFRGNEFGVEAEADGIDAGGGGHQPQAVDRFAAMAGNDAQRNRSADCHGGP